MARHVIPFLCYIANAHLCRVKIVSEASACLQGYPNLSIPADHSRMCKFDGKDDESYQKVSDVLQRWTRELGEPEPPAEEVGNPIGTP